MLNRFLAALLFVPALAHAQFWIPVADPCLGVSLSYCQRPEALTGSCAARCRDVLRIDFYRQASLAPQTLVTVPEGMPGAGMWTPAALTAAPASAHFMAGGTTTTALVTERHKTQFLSGPMFGGAFFDPHQAWRTNGPRVESCDEYVFDLFRSVSDFEDANRGAKALDVFRAAFAPGGIAFQDMRTANGVNLGAFPLPPARAPKNAYFTPLDLRMPAGAPSSNAAWNSRLAPYASAHRWDWAEHRIYGNWFSWFYTPDHLDSLFAEQQEYLGRLRARSLRYDRYEKEYADCVEAFGASHFNCTTLTSTAASDLSTMDFGIGFELTNADARGALNPSVANPWDWSPQFFVAWMGDNLSRVREPQRKKCMDVSAGTLKSGLVASVIADGLRNAAGGYVVSPGDWLATPGDANVMFSLIENYAKGLDVPRDPNTGKAKLYQQHGDTASLGNDRFGAEWAWDMGWGLTNIEHRFCDGQLEAKGAFWAKAKVLGSTQSLLDVNARAWSVDSTDVAGGTDLLTHRFISVLGTTIYAPADTSTPLTFHLSASASANQSAQVAMVVVPVLGVPVTVKGGISGSEGLEGEVTGGLTRTCPGQVIGNEQSRDTLNVGVSGLIKPHIAINAWVTASVDALVIEVGVKGEVTLVKAELPLTLRVETVLPATADVSLEAETRLALTLSALDGRVAVYGRFLGRSTERELISWSGPHLVDTTLFELRYVPAVRFDALALATRL
ncbi:MAG: hypothetical protein JNM17_18385 [Archangium sp.]|nr:hypothetical protein [Archangium sp.]